jgi:hypothetical protein
MPKVSVDVPHTLTEEEALGRVKGLMTDVKRQYATYFTDLQENWSEKRGEFSLKAMGFNISGTIAVAPQQVAFRADLPFAATPFKGRIEGAVRDEATRLLA